MSVPIKLEYHKFPVVKLVFQYPNEKKATRNVRVAIRNKAQKLCKHTYLTKVDTGGAVGRKGTTEVPINTMGRFIFGMSGYRARMYAVPLQESLELYMYTDNMVALMMVKLSTEGIGMRLRYACMLDGASNEIIDLQGSLHKTVDSMMIPLRAALANSPLHNGSVRFETGPDCMPELSERYCLNPYERASTISYQDIIDCSMRRIDRQTKGHNARKNHALAVRDNSLLFCLVRAALSSTKIYNINHPATPVINLQDLVGQEGVGDLSAKITDTLTGVYIDGGRGDMPFHDVSTAMGDSLKGRNSDLLDRLNVISSNTALGNALVRCIVHIANEYHPMTVPVDTPGRVNNDHGDDLPY